MGRVKQGSQQSLGSHNADESIELESLDGLAMQCLSTLLSRTNSASIGVVLDVLFGHFTTMTALSVSEEQCVEVFANVNSYLQVCFQSDNMCFVIHFRSIDIDSCWSHKY
jgi:hypothetical protein